MNETVKKAIEIQNKGEFKGYYIPELEVGEECEINDLWDGNGNCPTESYSYLLDDMNWINYEFDVIEKKDNELETVIRITQIELL